MVNKVFLPKTIRLGDGVNTPKPCGHARHFISEYTKRMFNKGEMDYETATKEVPLYRGLDNRVYRDMVQRYKKGNAV